MVVFVYRIIDVADVHPVEVNPLFFKDADLLFPDPGPGGRVGGDGHSCAVVGTGGGPEHQLLRFQDRVAGGHLDYPGLDAGALDPFLNLPDPQGGDKVRRPIQETA